MKTVKSIGDQSPFPWSYVNSATVPGQLVVLDAKGNMVPLFDVLDFVALTTGAIASQAGKATAS